MALYFFDITEADRFDQDKFGVDIASEAEVKDEALALLPLVIRDATPDPDGYEVAITVRDGHGRTVYEASLAMRGRWWPGRR